MSRDQYFLVHELVSLIKNNYPCKCLILAVEEELVKCVEDRTSLDGVLELIPMSSFDRMVVHRLADIFGFSHQSVGEGKDRHLVLERSPEASIPDTLVSRVLWKYRKWPEPITHYDVLLRKKVLPDKGTKHELTSSDGDSGDGDAEECGETEGEDSDSSDGDAEECGEMEVEDVKMNYMDETDTNSSKKMKMGENPMVCDKCGQAKVMDGWSKEGQQKKSKEGDYSLAVLKNDTPDDYLKL